MTTYEDLQNAIAFTQNTLNDLRDDLQNLRTGFKICASQELEDILADVEYSCGEVRAGIRAVIANFEILIREAEKDE